MLLVSGKGFLPVAVGHNEEEKWADSQDNKSTPDWSLWYIHGRAYDLTTFMDRHPGGADALKLARGRDCTALFESYHPFTDKPRRLLPKFLVPHASMPSELAVAEDKDAFFRVVETGAPEGGTKCVRDPFWEALRRNCGVYLKEHNLDTAMSWPFFLFGLAMIVVQITIYYYGFLRGSYPAALALGLVSWLLAGVFGHEGLHYGISRRHRWLNHVLGYFSISTVANPFIWKHQHTYSHHSFTNEHERDPDCHHFEMMLRMHFANTHNRLHRFLVHPIWVLTWWSQAARGSTFLLPIKSILTGTIQGTTSLHGLSWRHCLSIIAHTVLFVVILWVLPYCILRKSKMEELGLDSIPVVMPDLVLRLYVLITCFQTTLGALFGIFTQSTHLTIDSMAAAIRSGTNSGWARQQVETAANFAEDSVFWFVMSGGTNLQINHHLFPGLSHGVLRKLTPIIRRTCHEHGVRFTSYTSFFDLLHTVFKYFKRLADPLQPMNSARRDAATKQ